MTIFLMLLLIKWRDKRNYLLYILLLEWDWFCSYSKSSTNNTHC